MAECQMTLVDRRRIARDTMAFWFDTDGARYEFRAGQHADFVAMHPCMGSESDNSRTFSLASDYKLFQNSAQFDQGTGNNRADSAL
jgi:ferredoxin-NADP reductase